MEYHILFRRIIIVLFPVALRAFSLALVQVMYVFSVCVCCSYDKRALYANPRTQRTHAQHKLTQLKALAEILFLTCTNAYTL